MTSRQSTQEIQQKNRVTLPPANTTLNFRPAGKNINNQILIISIIKLKL